LFHLFSIKARSQDHQPCRNKMNLNFKSAG
jgi:hypothetical protein